MARKNMPKLIKIKSELKKLANPKQAKILMQFFKIGKGEYGEGDIFLGIKVPVQRQVVKKYQDLPLKDVQQLLNSKIHEHRLVGVLILVRQFMKGDEKQRGVIYKIYLKNTRRINNWDLVDLSAPNIVGTYLLDKPRKILYQLAKSKNLWERRIGIMATFIFIRNNDFKDTLAISKILLNDPHDLIHKAVGWMLRELGKRDQVIEEKFLKEHFQKMPRTMLRYAIEKFPEKKRQGYLRK
ncbi:DNA alkylation repair protein [Patescibacteria group bacterium]|nr:DNA alkylation repair protein [Patescibacteria group bacterium]MBU0964183.1 DNA alkylation repair protein [Patescibacteria group bacterium]